MSSETSVVKHAAYVVYVTATIYVIVASILTLVPLGYVLTCPRQEPLFNISRISLAWIMPIGLSFGIVFGLVFHRFLLVIHLDKPTDKVPVSWGMRIGKWFGGWGGIILWVIMLGLYSKCIMMQPFFSNLYIFGQIYGLKKSQSYHVRLETLQHILTKPNPKALPQLRKIISDSSYSDSDLVELAVRSLYEIGDNTSLDLLTSSYNQYDENVKEAIVNALKLYRDTKSIDKLVEIAQSNEYSQLRINALHSLNIIGMEINNPTIVGAMINMLSDSGDDINVRRWAALSLGSIGDKKAIPELVNALKDPNAVIRHDCVSALGEIGEQSTLNILKNVCKNDANPNVRSAASRAIKRIANK
ncbi:MAG: HEAT repeat domain-containing protein [Planctomycetota bacterium]|nr:MAG: HEAT repeat domain-containing protein [Planctomycetota bacterium]